MKKGLLFLFFTYLNLFAAICTSGAKNFEILDLSLGMTIDEAKEKYPTLDVKLVKHWGTDEILYYKGSIEPSEFNKWQVNLLLFSSFKEGKKLYKLDVEQFVGENVLDELKDKVVDRFGTPDCSVSGETGDTVEFKWGSCNPGDRFSTHTATGKYIKFFYDGTQIHLSMENVDVSNKLEKYILQLDEKNRLKEVRELDF